MTWYNTIAQLVMNGLIDPHLEEMLSGNSFSVLKNKTLTPFYLLANPKKLLNPSFADMYLECKINI